MVTKFPRLMDSNAYGMLIQYPLLLALLEENQVDESLLSFLNSDHISRVNSRSTISVGLNIYRFNNIY